MDPPGHQGGCAGASGALPGQGATGKTPRCQGDADVLTQPDRPSSPPWCQVGAGEGGLSPQPSSSGGRECREIGVPGASWSKPSLASALRSLRQVSALPETLHSVRRKVWQRITGGTRCGPRGHRHLPLGFQGCSQAKWLHSGVLGPRTQGSHPLNAWSGRGSAASGEQNLARHPTLGAPALVQRSPRPPSGRLPVCTLGH